MQDQNQKTEEPGEITMASKVMFMAAGLIFLVALLLCFVDETI